MPKSNIYSPAQSVPDAVTGEEVRLRGSRVSVGWWKDKDVQIGVGHEVDPKDSILSGSKTTVGNYLGTVEEGGREWKDEWMTLDRHSINRLIRDLRKARDEAFGRDE